MATRARSALRTGIQQLQTRRGYRVGFGFTVDQQWIGTESECQTQLETLVNAGGVVDAKIEPNAGGYFTLTVSYSASSATDGGGAASGSDSQVITTWSRERSRSEKSLWTVPAVVEALATVTDEQKRARVRSDIEAYLRREIDVDVLESVLGSAGVDNNAALRQLMAHFAIGQEAYPVEIFTIRRTQVGPLNYLRNDDATFNRIWTRSTLIAQTTMPTDFKALVPTGYFLQSAASVSQLDLYRWQTVQEWDHADSFSEWIYGSTI